VKRNRARAFIILAIIGIVRSAGTVHATVQYTLTNLGQGAADGINDNGQVVGVSGADAFIYSSGTMTYFRIGGSTRAWAINSAGVVAGTYPVNENLNSGFIRQPNGSLSSIPLADAYAINDAGTVAGDHVDGSVLDAATYSGGTVTDLGTLGGNYSVAWGISSTGLVVGQARDSAGNDHAVYWANGVITTLSSNPDTVAWAVNSSGKIVGTDLYKIIDGGGIYHAVDWQNGSRTDLTPGEVPADAAAEAVNSVGTIVGYDGFATIWQNGVEQNLNNLIAPGAGFTLYDALGINDSGQIVGDGMSASDVEYAYLLTPISVPEPTSVLLLAIGCAGLGLRRIRAIKG
jgi:probable HAF family extracellular repeat protein